MSGKIARRGFLKAGGLAVGSAFLAGCGQQKETKPIAMSGKTREVSTEFAAQHPRFLPGCCAYSYGMYLSKGKMTYPEFFDQVVKMGCLGADMTVYWFKSTEPAYLDNLRHLAFKKGIPFSGAACRANTVQADGSKRRHVLAEIKKWVDVTDRLGASHLRVFGGPLPSGATLKQGVDWAAETLKSASEYSGKKGITLGLEDDEGIAQTSDVCLEIIHRVDSPYAGINLDITNFKSTPKQDIYSEIKACIPYATHVHIRDHFEENGEPVDLDRVWRMLAEGGYKGFVSAEWESQYQADKDAMTSVPKLVDKIKKLCRKYSTV